MFSPTHSLARVCSFARSLSFCTYHSVSLARSLIPSLSQAACAIASGPVAAWPTLEPLLINAGVWKNEGTHSNLDAVYGLSTAVQLGSSLPAGWIYDRYGGRVAALVGALLAAVGLVIMSVACFFPAQLSWLMFVGYPLAMLGGGINSYGIFAFMWLMPDDQNFVASLASGAQSLSDMLALVAVGLSSCCGVFIGEFFLLLSVMSVFAGIFCYSIVPSVDVVNSLAAVALSQGESPESCEAFAQSKDGDGFMAKEFSSVKQSWVLMKQHAGANGMLLVFSTVYMLSMMYPMQQMYFYYQVLFNNNDTATKLVNIFAVIYGIGGFVCSLIGGKLCDRLGIQKFTLAVAGCSVVLSCCLPFANFTLQIVAQAVMLLGYTLYIIIVNRFAMLYAPPHLFGTFSGVQMTFISVGMLAGMSAVSTSVAFVGATGISSPKNT